MNALSVTMSSLDPLSSNTRLTSPNYIAAWNSSKSLCATTLSESSPSISIRMKAQSKLGKIVVIPPVGGDENVDVSLFFNQLVEVKIDNYDGSSFSCGTSSPSIFTNFEFDCGTNTGYQVTVKAISDSPTVLKICSVGILSPCDCTQTSFLP